ncbi:MAG TPA: hypothetical protein DDZ51_26540 [Planctomycetaceae bacterium]|nr:hypothetical protein [Planctomycetaceae bacterium]
MKSSTTLTIARNDREARLAVLYFGEEVYGKSIEEWMRVRPIHDDCQSHRSTVRSAVSLVCDRQHF